MMIIEAGKCYRTRDGRKAGPMERWLNGSDQSWLVKIDGIDRIYNTDGSWLSSEKEYPLDLIAEWTDTPTGPVIEETVTTARKRIVPGIYGRVVVKCAEHSPNLVSVLMNGAFIGAEEIRAAAVVLNQLAEALE